MTKSALRHTANRVYSYATLIRQVLSNGITIGNITYYSRTTARHQVLAECDTCDILLGAVPRNCDDLLQLAIDRGLIYMDNLTHAKAVRYYLNGDRSALTIEDRMKSVRPEYPQ